MKKLDKNYLALQFRNHILSRNGSAFQSFFESIMEKADPSFEKVKPYGNKGDSGNDGYKNEAGVFYQVYAPNVPSVNGAKAAKKLRDDFQKLKKGWNPISTIKEYNFVFNDKYEGTIQDIEQSLSDLRKNNRKTMFKKLLANDLEKIFFSLDEDDIFDLGFHTDQRQALSIAYSYLEGVKTELDKENALFAQKNLRMIKESIESLDDENLSLEYEILECRCLQKLERVDEAREKYKDIAKRFPDDPRPLLFLAEIYLNDKEPEKNAEILKKAEKINSDFWLLRLEKIIRALHLDEAVDTQNIDEKTFPENPKERASFYRVYAIAFDRAGDQVKADEFLERAARLTPDRYGNYFDELAFIHHRMLLAPDAVQKLQMARDLLEKAEKATSKFLEYGDIGARNKASLNVLKMDALLVEDNIPEFERLSTETYKLAVSCYFDKRIEGILAGVLQYVMLPDDELYQFLDYLMNVKNRISNELLEVLILQFNLRNSLFTDGKNFFEEIDNQEYFRFVNDLEKDHQEQVLGFLQERLPFSIALANTLKAFPVLRRKIIENLPQDKNIQKNKLWLILNFDEEDFDEAFEILKQLDLSSLSYVECRPMLQVARQQKAWDFEITILEKLLEKEKNERALFDLKLQLLFAYLSLEKFPDVIELGEKLLAENLTKKLLDSHNLEALLSNTLIACRERGKVESEALSTAEKLLQTYPLANPTLEFKAGIEAEIFLDNNKGEKALAAVIDGVKRKKRLAPQEYAKLYFLFVRIGNQTGLNLESLDSVQETAFVKLRNKDEWYFIGDENELDAIPVSKTNNKYEVFIGKRLEETTVFQNKYSAESDVNTIELIFTVDQYVLWQTVENFHKLASQGNIPGVDMVQVPPQGDTVDIQYLVKFFEDIKARTEPLFELYCKSPVPLAVLAVSEGGLTSAVGQIQNEGKGFIHFSDGTTKEFNAQKGLAKRVIDEKLPFYIDGTSALFLSESGMLPKIHAYIPTLRTPQSVINLLADVAGKFRYMAGHTGYMGYTQGKLRMSSIEKDKKDFIRSNFVASIKLLESKPKSVKVISSANKIDCLSEEKVPAELCDACVLAQKENATVLTDDFLYLKFNSTETGKKAPEYFSSLALVRVLYEEGKLSFNEYLEYFGYLSSYRFRFLTLDSVDIEKAVFGEGRIKIVKSENIRRLNFPLTLAEEYSVPFQTAFRVVGLFFIDVLRDNTITEEVAEQIFIEILESFPTEMSKKDLGQIFLEVCSRIIENNKSKVIIQPENQLLQNKLNRLQQAAGIFGWQSKLWTPK
jgi:hypothetical protein